MIDLHKGDCLELIKQIPDKSVDLIVTDPPYLLVPHGGGKSQLAKRSKKLHIELEDANLTDDFDKNLYPELVRVCKPFNAYIWCSKWQIPKLLQYFSTELGFVFNILIWQKDNPTPTFNNTYLPDKEYCLFFRERGGISNLLATKLQRQSLINLLTRKIRIDITTQRLNRFQSLKH